MAACWQWRITSIPMTLRQLLLLTDGETHTAKAEEYAITLAAALGAGLTAIYIVDPALKKFTNEIYAVNRDECRAHLDQALAAEGSAGLAAFAKQAKAAGLNPETRLLYGEPEQVTAELVQQQSFDLVILGAKHLESWWRRFESCNLPERLTRLLPCPILLVK